MNYYFSYGSNNLEQIKDRLNNDNIKGYKAYLNDYYLTFGGSSIKWGGAVASILYSKDNSITYGTVYILTDREIRMLDKYEKTDSNNPLSESEKINLYRRIKINVNISFDNDNEFEEKECYVYIKNSTKFYSLPSDKYINACINNISQFWEDKIKIVYETVNEIKDLAYELKQKKHILI